MVTFEATSSSSERMQTSDEVPFCAHTNHFLSAKYSGAGDELGADPWTLRRLARMNELLDKRSEGAGDVDFLKSALGDGDGCSDGVSICE